MERIDIRSNGGAALNDGVLQLENGVAMDTTLRNVADQNNTTSPLLLSTTAVQVVSPLRITTDDPSDMYLDCEDGSTNNRFNITRNTASQQVNLNFASNPAGSTTTVGAIRTFTDGVNLGEVVKFREDGQVTFTERVNVEADSLVTTQGSSVIAASTTNANLVIAPNGTGALVAEIPDGTVTGGNARGQYAVDLQLERGFNYEVASGRYSFTAGVGNRASGQSSIAMGERNEATGLKSTAIGGGGGAGGGVIATADFATAIGGFQNNAAGQYSGVFSGRVNTASSAHSVVLGGQSNTASTGSHATVVGGITNTSSGQHSVSGGSGNLASAARSVSFGGSNNATSEASVCLGQQNVTTQPYSFSSGYFASSYLYGQKSHQNGRFDLAGDAQVSQLVARKSDTLLTAATTVLSLDGTGTTNLIIPTGVDRMWNVTIKYVAVVTTITGTATGVTVGDTKSQNIEIGFKKVGGVSSLVGGGSFSIPQEDASMGSASLIPTAGASQQLALTFTAPTFAGGGSVTMRVVAKVELVEVAY